MSWEDNVFWWVREDDDAPEWVPELCESPEYWAAWREKYRDFYVSPVVGEDWFAPRPRWVSDR